jgi:hypothetical protein
MTAGRGPARPAAPTRLRRTWSSTLRRILPPESRDARLLVALALVMIATIVIWPVTAPLSMLVLPMLLGSLILGPRQLPWFIVFMLLLVVIAISRQVDIGPRTVLAVLVLFIAGFIILMTSFRRTRLGVGGTQGESMLVDLRDRIQRQGGAPDLPAGWHLESALRSAGGTPFAGDFIVTVRTGNLLDVVLVDVSGKGEGAGTRALLLSGAFGGLLGALPPGEFLTAANDFLLRQNWDEGFATAVHLSLDVQTGAFGVRTAGHPPAAQRVAGSGRWTVHATDGPALGLIEGADFPCIEGTLRPGDAIMLYTDGLVETPSRDMGLGIDRMLGQAEQLLRGQFEGGARRMIDALGSPHDDRALLLIHRS